MVKKLYCISILVVSFVILQAYAQEDRGDDRIKAIINMLDRSKIEGNTIEARVKSCSKLDESVFHVQRELWVETHNITNLVKIWQYERDFIEREIERLQASTRTPVLGTMENVNGTDEPRALPMQLRIVLQSSLNNIFLANVALRHVRKLCSTEEFEEWIAQISGIFGRNFHYFFPEKKAVVDDAEGK